MERTVTGMAEYNANEFFGAERKMTNGDRIRSLSDEELAEYIWNYKLCHPDDCPYPDGGGAECIKCTLDWLQQEVDADDN